VKRRDVVRHLMDHGCELVREAGLCRAEEAIVCREGADGLARGVKERVVYGTSIAPRQAPQLGGQREREQKVRAGQQARGLFLEPGSDLLLLACRTVPVAAGSSHHMAAAAAWPGRDSRRVESGDGSSPFFIVRPSPSALAVRPRYYDLC